MKLTLLASSSSGNCALLQSGDTRILIDAGLSRRQIMERMLAIGERPEALDAICITHGHSDHAAGAEIARVLGIPLYLTYGTAAELKWKGVPPRLTCFERGTGFQVGSIAVESVPVPHDAVDPVGFVFQANGTRLGFVTDIGHITDTVTNVLADCTALFLEANHDIPMLASGPYPWVLRQRIMGKLGHLSNQAVAQFVQERMGVSVKKLLLGHISERTNHPQVVHLEASLAITGTGRRIEMEVIDPQTTGFMVEL